MSLLTYIHMASTSIIHLFQQFIVSLSAQFHAKHLERDMHLSTVQLLSQIKVHKLILQKLKPMQ